MAKKFIRKDAHKKKRLSEVWRKPKGITNKMRLKRKGHCACVRPGYGTKATERGKNTQGLFIVTVSNLEELKKVDPKTQSALITNVGRNKKIVMIAEAEKLKITLTNLNSEAFKKNTVKFLSEKKKETAEKKAEKETAEKEAEKSRKSADFLDAEPQKAPLFGSQKSADFGGNVKTFSSKEADAKEKEAKAKNKEVKDIKDEQTQEEKKKAEKEEKDKVLIKAK